MCVCGGGEGGEGSLLECTLASCTTNSACLARLDKLPPLKHGFDVRSRRRAFASQVPGRALGSSRGCGILNVTLVRRANAYTLARTLRIRDPVRRYGHKSNGVTDVQGCQS